MKRVVNDLSTPINEPDFRQHRTLREKFQVKKKKRTKQRGEISVLEMSQNTPGPLLIYDRSSAHPR